MATPFRELNKTAGMTPQTDHAEPKLKAAANIWWQLADRNGELTDVSLPPAGGLVPERPRCAAGEKKYYKKKKPPKTPPKTVLPAGMVLWVWDADPEFDEAAGEKWLALLPKKWNKQQLYSWRFDPREFSAAVAPQRDARRANARAMDCDV